MLTSRPLVIGVSTRCCVLHAIIPACYGITSPSQVYFVDWCVCVIARLPAALTACSPLYLFYSPTMLTCPSVVHVCHLSPFLSASVSRLYAATDPGPAPRVLPPSSSQPALSFLAQGFFPRVFAALVVITLAHRNTFILRCSTSSDVNCYSPSADYPR